MVAELKSQQQDEVAKRDWCIDELNSNKRSTDAAYDSKSSLENPLLYQLGGVSMAWIQKGGKSREPTFNVSQT